MVKTFGTPFHDFAGSTIVHSVGGVLALLGAICLGPRIRKYDKKGNSRTVRAAAEAMVKLLGGTDSKRGGFFVVKRTEAKQVGPTLSQLHVSPDDIDDVDPGEQILDE